VGFFGLPPSFVATVMMLWAPEAPDAGVQPSTKAEIEIAALEMPAEEKPTLEVVASSPLPACFGPGSGFGYRASPRTGRRTFHAGADFNAPGGTPVYAVRAGIVEAVATNRGRAFFNGYGNAVVVYHPELDQWSFYAHLRETSVEVGQAVLPGERIGSVGNTTNGRFPRMGAHLHFEVRRRTSEGLSPFPGAYRQYNLDPERWLTDQGVRFEDAAAIDREIASSSEAPIYVVRAIAPHDVAAL
jgi:murein DD-endopeptidase MepM/ murein hydrolase activator NlpD